MRNTFNKPATRQLHDAKNNDKANGEKYANIHMYIAASYRTYTQTPVALHFILHA